MLEKVDRIGSLFELYGELLTSRQKELTVYYYFDDLSLAEIAELLGISRQAVFFGLKRAEEVLEDYETKLGLYGKSLLQKSKLLQARKLLDECCSNCSNGNKEKLQEVFELLDSLLD